MEPNATSNGKTGSVLLVATAKLIRHALRVTLEACEGVTVVAEAGSRKEALELAAKLRPEAVICALAPSELDPAELARDLVEQVHLGVPVIVLTRHQEMASVVRALRSPVAAYLSTDMDPEALAAALQAVRFGLAVFSSEAREVLSQIVPPSIAGVTVAAPGVALTGRERQVLSLMVEGLTNREVSARLGLGLRTVEMHVAHIVAKLGARSRTDAVIKAMQMSAAVDREEQHQPTVSESRNREGA